MCGDCRVIDIHTNPNEVEDHRPMRPQTRSALVRFAAADDSEELARAEVYGLLARLWIAPPDARVAGAVRRRRDRSAAARRLSRSAVAVAGGGDARGDAGRPPRPSTTRCSAASASPRSFCTARTTWPASCNESPLALLRADLAALGLARDETPWRNRGPHRLRVRGDALPDRRRRRGGRQPGAAAALLPRPCADLGRQARRRGRCASAAPFCGATSPPSRGPSCRSRRRASTCWNRWMSKVCARCGAESRAEARICVGCGSSNFKLSSKLRRPPLVVPCPACKRLNRAGAAVCVKCGAALVGASALTAPAPLPAARAALRARAGRRAAGR